MKGRGTPRRRAAVALLVLLVLAGHVWVASWLPEARLGEGQADRMPRRIEVAYVRELQPTAPPAVAPVVVPRRKRARKPPPPPAPAEAAEAASAPPAELPPRDDRETTAVAAAPVYDLPVWTGEPEPAVETAVETPPPAAPEATPAAVQAAASAASAPVPFEWPPSTRLSYRLHGNYRGEVVGSAMVEWVRVGSRYQVHLDVYVGAQAAPLVGRRMSSDGQLTEQGLVPLSYDEETRSLFRELRRRSIRFEPDRVLLTQGRIGERLPGIQDAASQFVQLTWLFTTRPELLEVGRTIEMPLALPGKVDTWYYDVVGRETLPTPVGPVDTFHLKPRRAPKPGGDLVVDIWFAPSLQYLPVRLLVRQDEATYVDMQLEEAPQQAAPGR